MAFRSGMCLRRGARGLCLTVSLAFAASSAFGQARFAEAIATSGDGAWTKHVGVTAEQQAAEPWIRPAEFQAASLEIERLRATLAGAPMESAWRGGDADPIRVELPSPDGMFVEFDVVESPIMEPGLAAKFPEIKTYLGMGVDDVDATMRMTVTPAGVDVQVLTPAGTWYIDRYNRADSALYTAYTRSGYSRPHRWVCEVADVGVVEEPRLRLENNLLMSGETLRTYRLAVSATGEYTSFHGGTVAAGQAAIVTAMNRVNGIYEVEVAARMILVANNDQIVYTNAGSDPFSNNNPGSLLSQNQSVCDSVIGSANYDIGHVFSTGGGGVAFLGVVCRNGSKAGGVTGLPAPTGDVFWVDYVAHEMGHQFGANHTFNGISGSCAGGNRNGSTALEPGSASTIMGYAGICGSDNVQNNSDDFFHGVSYDEIRNYITNSAGNNCAQTSATGNGAPIVNAGPDRAIPIRTPFTLTASATDPNGDPLTFAWEQRDLGAAAALAAADNGNGPLFRARPPTTNPARTFPAFNTVLAGNVDIRERLPEVGRTMRMRATARDNRPGGGGVGNDEVILTVVGTAGPFEVTAPAQGDEWGATQSVQWDVAGTNTSPINCSAVDILLSTDGGSNFSTVLASNTPNDGFQTVTLPSVTVSNARIMVRSVDNYFFAVSRPFSIDVVPLSIGLLSSIPDAIDPGVATEIDVLIAPGSEGIAAGTPTLFSRVGGGSFTGSPMVNVSGNTWRATVPGVLCEETVEFYFSAQGTGGSTVTLPDNAPASSFSLTPGAVVASFSDDFQTNQGWTVSGDASDGQWQRGVPVNGDRGDPVSDFDGSGQCYVTDNVSGNSDVDNGSTILTSPTLDTTGGATISWAYWLNDIPTGELGGGDGLAVEISFNNGASWSGLRSYTTASSAWRTDSFDVPAITGNSQFRVRFIATDATPGDVVEAGLDAFSVSRFECENPETCPADLAPPTGVLNIDDVLAFLDGFAASDPAADIAAPAGVFDIDDVLAFLDSFAAGCP